MARDKSECIMTGGIQGGVIGAIGGVVWGFIVAGPLGAIAGLFLGASAGTVIGFGYGWLMCALFGKDNEQWPYGKPSFSASSITARPNPAQKDARCFITLAWTVVGNDDRALCEITYVIKAEAATPGTSTPLPPIRNNGITFGRNSPAFQTVWDREHDGRTVEAEIVLVATKNGKSYVTTERVTSITVPVMP